MNVGYLITRGSQYFPDRTAFVIDGQAVSYRNLNRRINRLANALLSLGLKKADRVALLFHNSPSEISLPSSGAWAGQRDCFF